MKRKRRVTQEGMEIKILLLTRNMTSRELAARIHKTEATVSDVISGKNRSQKTLHQIMGVLKEEEEACGNA